MNKEQSSGTGSFLMELMMVICFFILCASICMLAFAKADHLSRLAADRDRAVLAAESIAEVWKLEGLEGASELQEAFRKEMPELKVEVQVNSDEMGLETARIQVVRNSDQEELFLLEAGRYVRIRD